MKNMAGCFFCNRKFPVAKRQMYHITSFLTRKCFKGASEAASLYRKHEKCYTCVSDKESVEPEDRAGNAWAERMIRFPRERSAP